LPAFQPYEDLATSDAARYEKEMELYRQTTGEK
jgi:hypothetical protein